jgi:hypothetical protein
MLDLILEQPIVVVALGGLVSIALLFGWLQTGQKGPLFTALGVALITAVLATIGFRIETENESLRAMLYKTADDLENNRISEVTAVIYAKPSDDVIQARSMLETKKYVFTAARIKKIHEIDFSGPASERRAVVRMNVFVEGTFFGYTASVPRFVEITLYRVDGRWQVHHFIHDDPFEGFKNRISE